MTNKRRCCVPGCADRGLSHKVLHKFPKPDKERVRFDKWTLAIGDDLPTLDREHVYRRRLVCRSHFEEKYRLRFDRLSIIAVPTVNVGGIAEQPDRTNEQRDDQNTNTSSIENKWVHQSAQDDSAFTTVFIKNEPEDEIDTEKDSDVVVKKEPHEVVEVEVFMGEEYVVPDGAKAAEEARNIECNETKATECKKQCKELKDSNNREKSKKDCSSGIGAKSRKKYMYYNLISLLQPQDRPTRRSRESYEDADSEESLDSSVISSPKTKKIKKSDGTDDRLAKLYPTLLQKLRTNTPTINHPDEYYLLSLFPQFNSIKQEFKLDAKADMVSLLRKYNNLGETSARTSDMSHPPSSTITEAKSQPISTRRHSVC